MKYVYPAVFEYEEGIGYGVYFPDVEGAATCGKTLYEALEMAEDALAGMLVSWEDNQAGKYAVIDGKEIPMTNRIVEPTPINEVKPDPAKYASKVFVTLIKADTDAYRKILESLPPRDEDEENDNDDWEVPEKLAREICKSAGVDYPED